MKRYLDDPGKLQCFSPEEQDDCHGSVQYAEKDKLLQNIYIVDVDGSRAQSQPQRRSEDAILRNLTNLNLPF